MHKLTQQSHQSVSSLDLATFPTVEETRMREVSTLNPG